MTSDCYRKCTDASLIDTLLDSINLYAKTKSYNGEVPMPSLYLFPKNTVLIDGIASNENIWNAVSIMQFTEDDETSITWHYTTVGQWMSYNNILFDIMHNILEFIIPETEKQCSMHVKNPWLGKTLVELQIFADFNA